ncbi:MAG TPA: hypothetical protein PLR20_12170 [Syntrophales bacterium]|nr:hypothetical protein [Syntrophales bacterium]HPI57103.1 hypothetical protein [Syntrophales bacterium]HPN24810.1 hypothetical protein [Syntrophales bacterium]HQM30097.1 hypothetical protein [Syntrophales bacterium]
MGIFQKPDKIKKAVLLSTAFNSPYHTNKKPRSTPGVPHGLGLDNLYHQTPGGQTLPMKHRHHQPVLETIVLSIT